MSRFSTGILRPKQFHFRCCANLGEWSNISKAIEKIEPRNPWNFLWDDESKRKKLLPWYLTSELNEMLFKQEPLGPVLKELNGVLCDNRKAGYLKATFAEEMAAMWMLNEDLDSAEMYLKSSLDTFLSRWQMLDPMFRNVRLKDLVRMRGSTTLYEFLDVLRMCGTVETDRVMDRLKVLLSNADNDQPTLVQQTTFLRYKPFLSKQTYFQYATCLINILSHLCLRFSSNVLFQA